MSIRTNHNRGMITSLFIMSLLWLVCSAVAWAQCPAAAAGPLQCAANIPIPGWTTANGSPDVFAFNPNTRIMYFADRVNRGATAIDTTTWRVIGTLSPPNCATIGGSCPSGILVAPDLQKMVLTSRSTVVWIYNLLIPSSPPTVLTLPAGSGADELDYDPVTHRVYMGNTTAPYFVTVIDMLTESIVGQIPIPTSVEQPRFNPVDGLIYVNTPDDDSATHAGQAVIVIDPAAGTAGQILRTFPLTNCAPHAIDVDPATNVALIGCSTTPAAFQLMNLSTGAIVGTAPIDGNDLGRFNPNTRRWYFGAGHNSHSENGCPKDSAGQYPGVAVVSDSPTANQFVGEACSARNSGMVGVDPMANNVYVANRQFPVDPNSSTTGQSGMLVYHDTAPSVTGTPPGTMQAGSHVTLAAVSASGVSGTVDFSLRRRYMFVDGGLNGLASGFRLTTLVISTTVGQEVIPCGVDGAGKGYCQGHLLGDPMIGGVVSVSAGNALVARGTINLTATLPTFISVDAVNDPTE
jgi:hypothetical protein